MKIDSDYTDLIKYYKIAKINNRFIACAKHLV